MSEISQDGAHGSPRSEQSEGPASALCGNAAKIRAIHAAERRRVFESGHRLWRHGTVSMR
jgi:hypothetical protein